MRVIVVGAGKVGYSVAQILSSENHEVTVIDNNGQQLRAVEDGMDVEIVEGNGASPSVLESAGINETDLLIAVTSVDEINMIACLVAKQYSDLRTVARVSNPEYLNRDGKRLTQVIGIDLAINPERVTANVIAKLVDVPEAVNVEYYAGGRLQLLELKIDANTPMINKPLEKLRLSAHPFLIVAIIRSGKIIIPHGRDMLLPGDTVFITAETARMLEIERVLGKERKGVKNITILGGGRTGLYLAESIQERKNLAVKIIEKDLERCQQICDQSSRCLVINGDGTDLDLLMDEDIGSSDLFVAATGDDKVNLLVSLLAKDLGARKTVAEIRRSDYIPLLEKIGVDSVVSPRLITASTILKFVRRGHVLSVTLLEGARAEMLELLVPDHAKPLGRPLKSLAFPKGAIIGGMVRDSKVIIPTGDDCILPGDQLMVFAAPDVVGEVEELFS